MAPVELIVTSLLRVPLQEVCVTRKALSLTHSLLPGSDFGRQLLFAAGDSPELLHLCVDLNLELATNGFGSADMPWWSFWFVRSSVLFFWKSATHAESASNGRGEAKVDTFAGEEALLLSSTPLSGEASGSLSFTCSPRILDEDASSRVQKALRAVLIAQTAVCLTDKHLEVRQLGVSRPQRCRIGSSTSSPALACARPLRE